MLFLPLLFFLNYALCETKSADIEQNTHIFVKLFYKCQTFIIVLTLKCKGGKAVKAMTNTRLRKKTLISFYIIRKWELVGKNYENKLNSLEMDALRRSFVSPEYNVFSIPLSEEKWKHKRTS